jgi:arylsulfatase A-like enzyme
MTKRSTLGPSTRSPAIDRRRFLEALGGGAAVLASACRPRAATPTPPNLLVLLADDLRADALGYAGNALARTPHLDRLAARSARFRNAFVTTSVCWTSRASILAGQWASRHGLWRNEDAFSPAQLAATYPALLRAHGYLTAFVGKWGVGVAPAPEPGADPASIHDSWDGFWGHGDYWDAAAEADGEREDHEHLTSRMTEQALAFLRRRDRARPFCLSVSFKAPHVQDEDEQTEPFQPRPVDLAPLAATEFPRAPTANEDDFAEQLPFVRLSEMRRRWQTRFATAERYQDSLRRYHALTSGLDDAAGRILAALDGAGDLERTVVLFTSDNGFFLGEHGLAGKWTPHEESIRIPLLLSLPQAPVGGVEVTAPALNVDLAPTLLALTGAPVPAAMQGRSLAGLARGESLADWRSDWLYEFRWQLTGTQRAAGLLPIPRSLALREQRYKYVRFPDRAPPNELLYDLVSDPWEDRDLSSAADPALLARLRARLAELDASHRRG